MKRTFIIRQNIRCLRYALSASCACVVACATPATHPLARNALLPNPTIQQQPTKRSVDQPQEAMNPPTSTPPSPLSFETPHPVITISPYATASPIVPEVSTPSIQPVIAIEGPESASLKAAEQQTVHAMLLEGARLISVEETQEVIATHSLSIPFVQEIQSELKVYRTRDAAYGSLDSVGSARVDSVVGRAVFAVSGKGDYLLAGEEAYTPPREAVISIQDSVQEMFEIDTDDQVVAVNSFRTTQGWRIASVAQNYHVKNYLALDPFVLEPVILFLHGMGEREPRKLYGNITGYLRKKAANKEVFKKIPFFIPRYDSLSAVHVSKERIKRQLFDLFGSVPIILACHSMGCLVARDLAADPEVKDLIIGGVLLAGANLGSPWVPKKRMRASLASQPDATALLTAQTAALAKAMPTFFEYSQNSKSLSSLIQSLDEGLTSKGALSLATARDDTPHLPFRTKLTLGPYRIPFNEVLSEEDVCVLPCDSAFFPQQPTKPVIRYGRCYANFARELRIWERQQGLTPLWYAYAGYYRGDDLRKARASFLQRVASPELLIRYLADSTRELDEEGLKFAASLLADRVTKTGTRKRFSDGLVDPEDAWILDDGPYIESAASHRDNLLLDEEIIRQRLSGDIIKHRSFLRSHSQIVRGISENDSELFEAIARDFGSLLQSYRSVGSTYQESDLDGVREEIAKLYDATQYVHDAYDRIIVVKKTSVVFRRSAECQNSVGCADLSYDVILTTEDKRTGAITASVLKNESRRAWRVWHIWRLYDQ